MTMELVDPLEVCPLEQAEIDAGKIVASG